MNDRAARDRDAAIDVLGRAAAQSSYALSRTATVEGSTRTVLGVGHPDGDRIILDAMKTIECLQRARTAAESAIAQLREMDLDQGSGNAP